MNPTADATRRRFAEIGAALTTAKPIRPIPALSGSNARLDVPAYCASFGIGILKIKDAPGGGTMHCLERCVFDENHSPNEASIIQRPNGPLLYQCFHDSCSGRTWKDARRVISGDQPLGPWLVGVNGHCVPARVSMNVSSYPNAPAPPAHSGFEFIHNADVLSNLRPTEWRIEGVLTDYALYYNFGDPGSYKTFVEIDRLLHIASGLNYHGHRVKQGVVFYICGEGFQGIGRRIAAWHKWHKTRAKDVPFFISRMPTQLMDMNHLKEVRQQVDLMVQQYGQPAVVQLDTLARNFGAGDENSSGDMSTAISNLDGAFGTDYCRGLTHHTGHGNKDRARGSMALHGAADAAYKVSFTEGGLVLVECKKMKDAPTPPPMLFKRQEAQLTICGVDDRSFVLELEAEGEAAVTVAKPAKALVKGPQKKVLALLRNAGPKGMPYDSLRSACMDEGLYKRTDSFGRAADQLILKGLIQSHESGKYVQLTEFDD